MTRFRCRTNAEVVITYLDGILPINVESMLSLILRVTSQSNAGICLTRNPIPLRRQTDDVDVQPKLAR